MRKKITIVSLFFLIFIVGLVSSYIITSNQGAATEKDSLEVKNKPQENNTVANNTISETESPLSQTANQYPTNSNDIVISESPASTDSLNTEELIESSTSPSKIEYTNEKPFTATGTVKSPVFTHTKPLKDSKVLSTLKEGMQVSIVSEIYGWYKLDDNSYVYSSFINLH